MHRLIDINIYSYASGRYWTISAQSMERPDDPNDDPQPYGDSQDSRHKAEAIDNAESWAQLILANREARQVTIFLSGNEHKTLFLDDVKPFVNIQGQIDCEVSASELIESWKNGNTGYVIDKLARDHAGLAAVMIVQGAQDRTLTVSDCNSIANLLIDKRRERCQQ